METWVLLTVAAAFLQNGRFMLQKQLKGQLSTLGVTYARFLYGAPLALVGAALLLAATGQAVPALSARFLAFAVAGGIGQILATALLVRLFGMRNFAVGVTFSKTETVMTAVLSALVLGELVGPLAALAILITVGGVVLLSRPPGQRALLAGLTSPAALTGLASGAIFAVASIGYRGAALALPGGDFVYRAGVTLAFVTAFQMLAMTLWLCWREPGQVTRALGAWRMAGPVGALSAAGSFCWFAAFALENAAYVKALGQVELIFTFLASTFYFRERSTGTEIAGIVLVAAGIVVLLLGTAG